MGKSNQPPDPSGSNADDPANVRDARAEFERLSCQTPRDAEAERAFIEARVEIIRRDSRLSETEKRRAIRELRTRADGDR